MKTHVGRHAAALMHQARVTDDTLLINNPEGICSSCTQLLSEMFPPSAGLKVVLDNGKSVMFTRQP
jgi:hypothetical protein